MHHRGAGVMGGTKPAWRDVGRQNQPDQLSPDMM